MHNEPPRRPNSPSPSPAPARSNSRMQETRNKTGGAFAAILVAMMLLAYPLSIGPSFAVVGAYRSNSTIIRAFEVIYAPLRPFKKTLDPWIDFWDWYGIKR